MTFEQSKLPYAYDALEPAISAETMKLHYGKHHAGYVDKLNEAVKDTDLEGKSLEEVIQWAASDADRKGVFDNAAQAWNHAFFWECMSPNGGGKPDGALMRDIESAFGSYKDFRKKFLDAGAGQFGSGWVWLVMENGKLAVVSTSNADTPLTRAQQPLLTCDVWEHAYYLDYRNERPDFLETFIDKLVNWEFVAEQFASQGEGNSAAARKYQDAQQAFAESGKVGKAAREAKASLAE